MKESSKTYSVMEGEPHLGKQVETTITYEKEDIIELLVELFESDSVDSTDMTIRLGEEEVEIGTWLDMDDIDAINLELSYFLDDDWGSGKVVDQLVDWFENNIPNGTEYEYETVSYKS